MKKADYLTPLRYPGGKTAFAPHIKSLIEANDLYGCDYMEPYAGGAGVALDLLFSGHCRNIHINDFDLAIYHFWKSITQQPNDFLKLLDKTLITITEWEHQKDVLANAERYSDVEHGFAAFFLNRTNRSGILKGGVIGGKAQAGAYKLDARFDKTKLAKRIDKIAERAHHIHVHNQDAVKLLASIDNFLPSKSLVYLDPPYYIKGQGLYRNFYNHDDHVAIQEQLNEVNQYWLVSYDNCPEICEIYKDYRQDKYTLNYCAYHKRKGSEVLIYDHKLLPPSEITH